jgi:hypothetical protein
VQSVLDQYLPKFDFGTVTRETEWPIKRSVTLSSREVGDLRVTGVESAPAWLDVTLGADGRTVNASLKKDAPWGLTHNGAAYVKVGLNAPQQPHAWIEVDMNVHGDVVPDADPFQLGMLRSVGKHDFLLRLTNPDGKDFKLGKLALQGINGKVGSKACVPAAAGCRLISLSISNDQPQGRLLGKLEIELPELQKTLPVEVFGLMLAPETKIHDLSELEPASGAQSSAEVPAETKLTDALANAVKAEEPPPPGNGPLLRWSVAHQTRVYGYLIYRAETDNGPLKRVNKEIIPAVAEGKKFSGDYQWRDVKTEPGKTYWYQIGIVNRDGSKEDLSGRQKVVAK